MAVDLSFVFENKAVESSHDYDTPLYLHLFLSFVVEHLLVRVIPLNCECVLGEVEYDSDCSPSDHHALLVYLADLRFLAEDLLLFPEFEYLDEFVAEATDWPSGEHALLCYHEGKQHVDVVLRLNRCKIESQTVGACMNLFDYLKDALMLTGHAQTLMIVVGKAEPKPSLLYVLGQSRDVFAGGGKGDGIVTKPFAE